MQAGPAGEVDLFAGRRAPKGQESRSGDLTGGGDGEREEKKVICRRKKKATQPSGTWEMVGFTASE